MPDTCIRCGAPLDLDAVPVPAVPGEPDEGAACPTCAATWGLNEPMSARLRRRLASGELPEAVAVRYREILRSAGLGDD